MPNILAVSSLSVSFDGEPILENVTFALNEGEGLAIIGPNGAGKSVLLRALLGMIPYAGTITWAKNVRIGYVPQKMSFLAIESRLLALADALRSCRKKLHLTNATRLRYCNWHGKQKCDDVP
jgi:zinc transport system ATP-binding protein